MPEYIALMAQSLPCCPSAVENVLLCPLGDCTGSTLERGNLIFPLHSFVLCAELVVRDHIANSLDVRCPAANLQNRGLNLNLHDVSHLLGQVRAVPIENRYYNELVEL